MADTVYGFTGSKATDDKILEEQIMSSMTAKTEAEWWAKREIERLRDKIFNIRTLVLAEVEKLPVYSLHIPEGKSLYNTLYKPDVIQALTKLFEGGKEV